MSSCQDQRGWLPNGDWKGCPASTPVPEASATSSSDSLETPALFSGDAEGWGEKVSEGPKEDLSLPSGVEKELCTDSSECPRRDRIPICSAFKDRYSEEGLLLDGVPNTLYFLSERCTTGDTPFDDAPFMLDLFAEKFAADKFPTGV